MKKIIFNQLLKDITKFFLLSSLSLSLIIWIVQAVNFLDFISEDGHGLSTYFYITILNFQKYLVESYLSAYSLVYSTPSIDMS